jgi:hypothetical protein
MMHRPTPGFHRTANALRASSTGEAQRVRRLWSYRFKRAPGATWRINHMLEGEAIATGKL